jgi:TetR/AcrR family transcriptional regulator, transcriptional repressor for nem operon
MTGHIQCMPRPSLKEQIVDAAVETLHRKGFNGSSVQDITEAAQAPKGSFYNHFESKEDLAVAALQRYWERGETSREMLRDTQYPPLERLNRYLDHLAGSARKAEFRKGCLIGNMSTEMAGESRPVRARLAALFGAWTEAIESCVREAQADDSVRRDLDPASIAVFLLNSWEGALLRTKVDRNDSALEVFRRATSALLSP